MNVKYFLFRKINNFYELLVLWRGLQGKQVIYFSVKYLSFLYHNKVKLVFECKKIPFRKIKIFYELYEVGVGGKEGAFRGGKTVWVLNSKWKIAKK